jgi:N-acetylglucosamine kinase-like BadF-type ATPase
MPPPYLGLDFGGSGTRAALVGGDGRLLARGVGPTGLSGGGAAGRRHLARALNAALAGIAPRVGDQPCSVFVGTRGLSIPGRREAIVLELHTRFANAEINVSNDAFIALWGALAGREGVAVLAGSGSIALARAQDGREGRAGGWGYLLGDEGSGYWLGREALAAYMRTLEGRDATGALAELVSREIKCASVPATIAWLYAGDQQVARLAELAPLVTQASSRGDPFAGGLLRRAGAALADLAAAAARQVWPVVLPEGLLVAGCGGVWLAGDGLVSPFVSALAERLPGARYVAPALSPVGGAILLAMGADRHPIDRHVLDNLREARL